VRIFRKEVAAEAWFCSVTGRVVVFPEVDMRTRFEVDGIMKNVTLSLAGALFLGSLAVLVSTQPVATPLSAREMRSTVGAVIINNRQCIPVGTCSDYNEQIIGLTASCPTDPCSFCSVTGSDEWEFCQHALPEFRCEFLGTNVNDCGDWMQGDCDANGNCVDAVRIGGCAKAPACNPD